jgi:two-component system chemotaxis response regulator CheY
MVRDMRFLVVDNNSKTCKLTVAQLLEIGIFAQPREAGDGAAALAILKCEQIDFVIVSWGVAGTGGLGLVRSLRADSDLRRLLVLLVAAEAKRDNAAEAAAAGANDYILRPFSADSLEKKIVRIATLARMLALRPALDAAPVPALHGHHLPVPIPAAQSAC